MVLHNVIMQIKGVRREDPGTDVLQSPRRPGTQPNFKMADAVEEMEEQEERELVLRSETAQEEKDASDKKQVHHWVLKANFD